MTRKEVLQILLAQARSNGFEFRKWYQSKIDPAWESAEVAIENLGEGNRYYALLFSHEFARAFWKKGSQISFVVPTVSYTRRNPAGDVVTVTRKAFTRRTLKPDVWRYHLREMAAADDPLRYIRRFVPVAEDLGTRSRSKLPRD